MSAQDKLGIGVIAFTVCLLAALLLIPPSIYRAYRADLERRRRERLLRGLMGAVVVLALPYFYDELMGLADRRVALLLEVSIGACTGIVLLDVAGFLYRQSKRSSRLKRQPRL